MTPLANIKRDSTLSHAETGAIISDDGDISQGSLALGSPGESLKKDQQLAAGP